MESMGPNRQKKVEYFYSKKHANIAISESTQQCYQHIYGETPQIIFNGLQSVEQKKFNHIIADKINILFAGRLEYQKRSRSADRSRKSIKRQS